MNELFFAFLKFTEKEQKYFWNRTGSVDLPEFTAC